MCVREIEMQMHLNLTAVSLYVNALHNTAPCGIRCPCCAHAPELSWPRAPAGMPGARVWFSHGRSPLL